MTRHWLTNQKTETKTNLWPREKRWNFWKLRTTLIVTLRQRVTEDIIHNSCEVLLVCCILRRWSTSCCIQPWPPPSHSRAVLASLPHTVLPKPPSGWWKRMISCNGHWKQLIHLLTSRAGHWDLTVQGILQMLTRSKLWLNFSAKGPHESLRSKLGIKSMNGSPSASSGRIVKFAAAATTLF